MEDRSDRPLVKLKNIKAYREERIAELHGACELCGHPIDDPCCDHNHHTGAVRGVICRRCNTALGRCENLGRSGIKDVIPFLRAAVAYLEHHSINTTGLLHPSHRTAEEKKALNKKRRARKRKLNEPS